MWRIVGVRAAIITLAIGCAAGCSPRAIDDDAATEGTGGALGTDAMDAAAATDADVGADVPIDRPGDAPVHPSSDAAADVARDAAGDVAADVPGCQTPSPDGEWQEGAGFTPTGTVASLWATSSTDVWAASNLRTSRDGGTSADSGTSADGGTSRDGGTPTDASMFAETTSLQHWNGVGWAQVAGPPGVTSFRNVWASGASDLWAATSQGLWRWNGTWTDVTPSATDGNYMTLVWGFGPNDVWTAKGASAVGAHHWNGAQWTATPFARVPRPDAPPTDINDTGQFLPGFVWGASSSDVWAGGSILFSNFPDGHGGAGNLDVVGYAHWDGAAWTVLGPATVADARLGEVWNLWGSSASNVFAVGDYSDGTALIEHFDGVAWSRVSITAHGQLFGVWGSCATSVSASGNTGGIMGAPLLLHFDGVSWSTKPTSFARTDTGQTLNTISGTGVDDLWIGGGSGLNSNPTLIGSVYHRHP